MGRKKEEKKTENLQKRKERTWGWLFPLGRAVLSFSKRYFAPFVNNERQQWRINMVHRLRRPAVPGDLAPLAGIVMPYAYLVKHPNNIFILILITTRTSNLEYGTFCHNLHHLGRVIFLVALWKSNKLAVCLCGTHSLVGPDADMSRYGQKPISFFFFFWGGKLKPYGPEK